MGEGWNYRIIRHPKAKVKGMKGMFEEEYFEIAEVYCNNRGRPNGWGRACTISDDLEGFHWLFEKFQEALEKPVLLYKGKKLLEEG